WQSGRCAQVKDAGTQPGDRIVQTTCTGAAEQQWTVA
ncbi:RICIN domain-containing protein, partial [Micromonospora sp. ATA32]|nr:RICIN domain-containing protein [Micromonospora sp. ATA32]